MPTPTISLTTGWQDIEKREKFFCPGLGVLQRRTRGYWVSNRVWYVSTGVSQVYPETIRRPDTASCSLKRTLLAKVSLYSSVNLSSFWALRTELRKIIEDHCLWLKCFNHSSPPLVHAVGASIVAWPKVIGQNTKSITSFHNGRIDGRPEEVGHASYVNDIKSHN